MLRVIPQHDQQNEVNDAQESMKGVTPMAQSMDAWVVGRRFDLPSFDVLVQSGRGSCIRLHVKEPFGLRVRYHEKNGWTFTTVKFSEYTWIIVYAV